MTEQQQIEFNHLHIEFIVQDKRFPNWEKLSHDERIEIIDAAQKLAVAEFDK